MATITSTIKMQDKATSTLNAVSKGFSNLTEKAQKVNASSEMMGTKINTIPTALQKVQNKYNTIASKQDAVNAKIEAMEAAEKKIVNTTVKQNASWIKVMASTAKANIKLMGLRREKDKLIQRSDKFTQQIIDQENEMNKLKGITEKVKPPKMDGNSNSPFSKWQAGIIAVNQGLQLTKQLAQQVKKGMDFSDELTNISARLKLINDGLQSQDELQNKIMASANRSRGSYQDMASSVAKLGLLAPDSFESNDEMIAFAEAMQKSFKVSGASSQEISSATYQLTQAMAAGKLQGDEFRSIMENAPMLAQAIADYTGKSKGELKEMSSEGLITADIIKNALFTAADDINEKYEQMPVTFADIGTRMQNNVVQAFQPTADRMSKILSSAGMQKFLSGMQRAITVVVKFLGGLLTVLGKITEWIGNNLPFIQTALIITAAYMLYTLAPAIWATVSALWAKAAAWAAANWQLLAILGVFAIAYMVFGNVTTALKVLTGAIAIVVVALAAWKIAQWALNGALYACPIVWIIALVIAVIVIIYLVIDAILQLVGATDTALGVIMGALFAAGAFIWNLFAAVINFVVDAFGVLWNFIAAFVNFFANVFTDPVGAIARLFFDLVDTILGLLEGLAGVIDTIFGSNLAGSVKGWRNSLGGWVDKTFGEENEVMAQFDSSKYHLGRFEYGEAYNSGVNMGNDISNKISNFSMDDLMGGIENTMDDYAFDYGSMVDSNGNVPVDVAGGEVSISDEDLKMLKDIATRDYMLNYKQITPNVNIEFGDVRETADVNEVKNALQRMMEEELAELYVVEEA